MSHLFLAAPVVTTPPPTSRPPGVPAAGRPRPETLPKLMLESLDRRVRLPLDESTGWKALAGASGLNMPPVDVVTEPMPGAYGSLLQDVRVLERPIFIPVKVTAPERSFVTHQALVDALMQLVDPLQGQFRVVGTTPAGERELTAIYTGGLEGDFGVDRFGLYWRKLGLTATACDPWAYDRSDRVLEFRNDISEMTPFLGVEGGTDAPWPSALSTATVIGLGMPVQVTSEVPVYPVVDLVGPMDSFTGDLSPELPGQPAWSVSIPDGVPAGSTLRLVTDPRARSIRMGPGDPALTPGWTGDLAAGQVARGSSLRPFLPGLNVLDVVAPGGTEETRVRLSWREAHRSLW